MNTEESEQTTDQATHDGLYRIAWREKATGKEGHGERIFSYEQCERMCRSCNRDHPDIHHWPCGV